jgi:hypothetical protein
MALETKYKSILTAASYVLGVEINDVSQLSDSQLIFFSSLSKYELNRTFIQSEILQGRFYTEIANKYNVSKEHVKDVANRLKK